MGRPLILAPDDLGDHNLPQIGGKARGLLYIHRAMLRTPEWRVLPFETVSARAWHDDPVLRAQLHDLFNAFDQHVAVRSSAEGEDTRATSNAGQFHTAFADAFGEMLSGLDAVADSARGGRMAIVVQRALAPEIAGVAFSADPARARTETLYLEAVRGHGKQLVDGSASPVRMCLDLNGNMLSCATDKRLRLSVSGVNTPDPILSQDTDNEDVVRGTRERIGEITRAILTLEDQLDAAVDIEWAVAGGMLYILQARLLTALAAAPELRPPTCHTSWFFDQRFLKPISPLTRTTLIPLILRASLGSALEMRGRNADEARAFFYGGQAYVAHEVWRHMLDGAPRWFLSPDLRQIFPPHCACESPRAGASAFGYAWDAARTVLRHRREVFLNVTAWRRFRDGLPHRIDVALALPDFVARWHALDALSVEFLALHRWSILWADYAFRLYNLIGRLLGTDRAKAALHENMHLPTAEANAALELARTENTLEAWQDLAERYGHRSPSLDYAAPTWREIYLGCGSGAAALTVRKHATSVNPRAEPKRQRCCRTPNGARSFLGALLTPIRRLLEMREEQRFNWERVLATQRALALDLGREWAASGALSQPEDVFLLDWHELTTALENEALPSSEILAARRHVLRVEALVPKPLFLGPVESDTSLRAYRSQARFQLQGVGASSGRAHGRIVHLNDPAQGLPPDAPRPCIAVVYALDPAHTSILREAAGVVAERGGLLSHAAILAREYGVPLVTALDGAFSILPENAEAEIDGQAGTITLRHPDEVIPASDFEKGGVARI